MGELEQAIGFSDKVGYSTLSTISKADRFNRWMYKTIAPWCKGEILEIGAGTGNISIFFLNDKKNLTISELQMEYCRLLNDKFREIANLQEVIQMDIRDPDFSSHFKDRFNSYQTIVALNVAEHIEDRDTALQNCKKLLIPGGTLILLVPAFQCLYNRFDSELGHFLRFSKSQLTDLMNTNGLQIENCRYFNAAGIAGWWFAGSLLKKKMIPEGSMKLYNWLVPVFQIMDHFTYKIFGLSLIVVCRKIPDLQ